ncbi:MAG: hypothetical protein HOP33_09160 [Verrucomicrobia bacterium]|nr:hypothetical protein [Verrucomicrobiota bacterium]
MNNTLAMTVDQGNRSVTLCFDIPQCDRVYFSTLPEKVQTEVWQRLKQMAFVAAAKKVNTACKQVAASLKSFARGFSWQRIRALFYQFTKGTDKFAAGDWRILVNWSKVGASRSELSPTFIEFWRMLCEQHQRVTSSAWRQLVFDIWRGRVPFQIKGKRYQQIPGYDVWPEAEPETDLPAGWSEGNLYNYTPDRYELAAARIGIQKASSLGFKIRTTRLGLKIGEFMEFDDHEFNVKVNFPGQMRSMRPRCFGAVDALSDCMFSMVIKPTFWDMDAQAKQVLSEKDFMWFVVAVLTHRGYRADIGTMLLVEHGTATVRGNKKLRIDNPLRDDFEKRIFDATGGKVRVDRGGRFHTKANPGQFAPPSGGNFRFKPHVEQFWRMLDDWLDAVKGQTGKGRDFAPEEMERTDAYNNKLLKVAQAMGVEDASKLILPRMTFDDFTNVATKVMGLINDDPDHACNSWEKCGFITKEYRAELSSTWNPLALLAREQHEVQALVSQSDLHFRVRRMTRAEADRTGTTELTPLPFEMIPSLVGPEYAGRPIPVIGGKFQFKDWRLGPDPLVFVAQDSSGHPLREGERFIPYCNPMSPDALVICDASGSVVSVCPPDLEPAKNDEAGVKAAMGAKNHWQAVKLAGQRARHAPAGSDVEFMKRHNAAVMDGKTVSPEDRQRQRNVKRFSGDAEVLAENTKHQTPNTKEDFSAEALL